MSSTAGPAGNESPSDDVTSIGFSAEERLRSLALLQEKTASLIREVQARKNIEIELRRAQEEMRQQLEDLHKLHDLSKRLLVTTALDEVLHEVLKTALDVYKTDMGALYLTCPGGEGLQIALHYGFTEAALADFQFVPPGKGVTGTCFAQGRSIAVTDMKTDPAFTEYFAASQAAGFRSVHSTPLFNRSGKIIGVLSAYFREPCQPSDREMRLVDLHMRQAADAIEAARMREMSQLAAQEKKGLEQAKQHLVAIVESAHIGIASKNMSGIITSWNKGAERILGYTADEIVGKSILELIPPQRHEEEANILARLRKGERIEEFETVRRHKNGALLDVSLTVSPIVNESGEVEGASKLIRDVTERKRFEADLNKSEMRFRDMADSAPVFVWISNPIGFITYFNKPWLEFRGQSLEHELGLGWMKSIHPDDFARFKKNFSLSMPDQTSFRVEARILRADGEYRWILNTGTPRFSADHKFLGFIGSGLDITDLKNAEDKLRQAQKMEAVGRLAGGIAHDFNNLLTVINGYTALALRKIGGADPLSEYLTEIKNSGERAALLTQQLLAYSRKQILAPKVFNLNETVIQMEKMLRHIIGEDITLTTSLCVGLGSVKADPGQVQQIILNMVINARDAMPLGGSLTIETGNESLNGVHEHYPMDPVFGPHVRLSIKDNGIGMRPEVKAKIFEPFFTTKDVGQGTGLGLSSAYGIIKQSGGSIAVTSHANVGSTFHIFFPMTNEAGDDSRRPEPAATPSLVPCKGNILVVEDEEMVRKFVAHTLSAHGYTVFEANDGEAAMEILSDQGMIDLVLTDVVMPKMNGGKMAEIMKALQPSMRVLFMSGYTTSIFLSKGLMEPGSFFLQKPFTEDQLIGKVQEILLASITKTP